jgi:hypothetical protein
MLRNHSNCTCAQAAIRQKGDSRDRRTEYNIGFFLCITVRLTDIHKSGNITQMITLSMIVIDGVHSVRRSRQVGDDAQVNGHGAQWASLDHKELFTDRDKFYEYR